MSRDLVPMMFRAQIEGRCQIQRLIPKQHRQDADDWVDEWREGTGDIPKFSPRVKAKQYRIAWRFVTNSGQDEGVIRPVIGAGGFPYYPGASMKGAFLRACSDEEGLKYCGGEDESDRKKTQPGILRFHGGYPKDDSWKKTNLVDVVHPQEKWQVTGEEEGKHSAFIQISLYKPIFVFGISSIKELDKTEWEKIWGIWEVAIARGLGCRVSAGYGQPVIKNDRTILSVGLRGEGIASLLINKEPEFRPNMFKAALRGHTLRLFSGVTDKDTAQLLTKELWGGFNGSNGSFVGKLGIGFRAKDLDFYDRQYLNTSMQLYYLKESTLEILPMREIPEEEIKRLRVILIRLIKFSLLIGGFGKSWRRVHHQTFYPDYLRNKSKPMIGCHWQFTENSKQLYLQVNDLGDINEFLEDFHKKIKAWVKKIRDQKLKKTGSDYREAWHPENVEVWARIAENVFDSHAVKWFHGPYEDSKSIKNSELTGKLGEIGGIWHRMYPRYLGDSKNLKETQEYVEILTIFPDESENTKNFLEFLDHSSDFTKVWPNKE